MAKKLTKKEKIRRKLIAKYPKLAKAGKLNWYLSHRSERFASNANWINHHPDLHKLYQGRSYFRKFTAEMASPADLRDELKMIDQRENELKERE